MYVFGYTILGLVKVIDWILSFYMVIIIIRALLSWFSVNRYNPIVEVLYGLTDPVLRRVQKIVPPYKIGVDFSPMIVILIIIFLQAALVPILDRFGRSLL